MPSGFFLGGVAEGMSDARKQDLAELTQQQDYGLRSRGLDIQERAANRAAGQDAIRRGDELIASTMGTVAETIKTALAAGRDPDATLKAVAPLVASAKTIAGKIGRDPASLDAYVQAAISGPTGVEGATAEGVSAGTKEGTKQKTMDT